MERVRQQRIEHVHTNVGIEVESHMHYSARPQIVLDDNEGLDIERAGLLERNWEGVEQRPH